MVILKNHPRLRGKDRKPRRVPLALPNGHALNATAGRTPILPSLLTLFCGMILFPGLARTPAPPSFSSSPIPNESRKGQDLPAYHHDPPRSLLPTVIRPHTFEQPVVQNAYRLARGLVKILYQQPCYCRCDRHHGHRSLLDCYTTKHAAGCGTCLQELFYVYEQTGKAKTAAQIREGIVRGDWMTLDTQTYEQSYSTRTQP